MNYWKENINYRQEKDANGMTRYFITIDDQDIEVDKKLYGVYTKMERRERYLVECDADKCISLEKLSHDELFGEDILDSSQISVEDEVITKIDATERIALIDKLPAAIRSLTESEQELIQAIYFDGISAREYARRQGVYPRAIMYRLEKLQEKLRQKIFF